MPLVTPSQQPGQGSTGSGLGEGPGEGPGEGLGEGAGLVLIVVQVRVVDPSDCRAILGLSQSGKTESDIDFQTLAR
ncbi:MAG: hypothetical protein PHY92_03265 [Alphaproteobacteria bacterium]|nr:hypothetical protein [Alphaproteobacteria bacterium]